MTGIFLAAIAHGAFQVIVLCCVPRGNRVANGFLAALVGLISLSMWNMHVFAGGLPESYLVIDRYLWGTTLAWGPSLYFYTLILCGGAKPEPRIVMLHVAPAAFVAVLQLPVYMLLTSQTITWGLVSVIGNLVLLLFYLQFAAYIVAAFAIIRRYQIKIKNEYSKIGSIDLVWLQRLLMLFSVIIVVDCIIAMIGLLSAEMNSYFRYYMTAEAVAIFAIGYLSLLHNGGSSEPPVALVSPKYADSPLSDELANEIFLKLTKVMERDEAFLENDLRLAELAERVGVSAHHLSQVINQKAKSNFYEFVNGYRVKRAGELLARDNSLNLTALAFDVGFNNRVSFITAFKKQFGMPPSRYRLVPPRSDHPAPGSDA